MGTIPAFECSRCGQPAEGYDTEHGRVHHLDHRIRPCPVGPANGTRTRTRTDREGRTS